MASPFHVVQDHGKTSATASLGMITLWDVEGGLPQIDKYLYSRDNHVVAGTLWAVQCIVGCDYMLFTHDMLQMRRVAQVCAQDAVTCHY